jgi:hypothetical protein
MTQNLPAKPTDGVDAFVSAHGGPAGEFLRFSKEATFKCASDGTTLPEGTRLACVYDQTQHGLIRFNGPGQPPTRHMGGMFDGYVPPPRSELGDDDQSLWETGLSGQPQDPWQWQVLLPLQDQETGKLYIFQTSSVTGLRSVATLISTCKQMAKREPDVYPVVELRVSAFESKKNPRIGLVKKPDFKIVGKVNRNGAAPQISAAATLNDEIPW